ncbi:MAG: ANTAR domain-containing response regulator [Bacillota bacterium]
MYGTRIVIADADAAYRRSLREAFRHADYFVVGEAADARSMLQMVFQADPHVVVMDPRIPGSEGIDLIGIIDDHRVAPVVAIVSHLQSEIGEIVRLPGVYGILLKPLHDMMVQPVIESALANFDRARSLEKEINEIRRELENRKLVERAKGVLMDRKKISEKEAHKYLQKISMDKCIPIARVARDVLVYYQRHSGKI